MLNPTTTTGVGRLERATTGGVLALAAGSFVLSSDALHQLAIANHVPRPLAWIWPLIVDGFIITASLAVLHAVLRGRPAGYPWLLVLAFSATSIAFNVLHAPPTPVARAVAAIPPLTLVLSFDYSCANSATSSPRRQGPRHMRPRSRRPCRMREANRCTRPPRRRPCPRRDQGCRPKHANCTTHTPATAASSPARFSASCSASPTDTPAACCAKSPPTSRRRRQRRPQQGAP
jgi:hypothetical protein